MARVPKPSWDITPDEQSTAPRRSRKDVSIYGPSTDVTQADAARSQARAIANLRADRQKQRKYINGRWFEGNQLIGTAATEDALIHRVKPRSLRQRGQS